MSTFNSADIAAFNGGVWVFCEQRQGTMMPTSFELISEGRKLADELGTKLYGILLGHNIEGIAKELGGYGADGVYVCDHPLLENYTTDGYTKVICDVVAEYKPEMMLIGATINWYAVTDMFAGSGLETWFNNNLNYIPGFDELGISPFYLGMPASAKFAAVGFMIFGCGVEMAGITVSRGIVKWFKGREMALAMGSEMALARLSEHHPNNQICILNQGVIEKYISFKEVIEL